MAIPIRFWTVVFKKQALEEKYPGGLKRFQEGRPGGPFDDDLVGVIFMSCGEVDELLDMMRSLGFNLPSMCAIADETIGPTDGCPGITFHSLTPDADQKRWRAVATRRRSEIPNAGEGG